MRSKGIKAIYERRSNLDMQVDTKINAAVKRKEDYITTPQHDDINIKDQM